MFQRYKSLALSIILAITIPLLVTSNLVNAEITSSSADTSETQTFSYNLNGYPIVYGINNNSAGYLIAIYNMDVPPLQISFTEQLPNGTENRVTRPIAYGMTIPSANYPINITFMEITETPKPTATTNPSQTPAYTGTLSSNSTPIPVNPSVFGNKAGSIAFPLGTLAIAIGVATVLTVILVVLLLRRHPKPPKV